MPASREWSCLTVPNPGALVDAEAGFAEPQGALAKGPVLALPVAGPGHHLLPRSGSRRTAGSCSCPRCAASTPSSCARRRRTASMRDGLSARPTWRPPPGAALLLVRAEPLVMPVAEPVPSFYPHSRWTTRRVRCMKAHPASRGRCQLGRVLERTSRRSQSPVFGITCEASFALGGLPSRSPLLPPAAPPPVTRPEKPRSGSGYRGGRQERRPRPSSSDYSERSGATGPCT